MTTQRTTFASWSEELAHRDKRIAKLQKVQGIEALLAEWEARNDPDDHEYLLHLRDRLRRARHELDAMA